MTQNYEKIEKEQGLDPRVESLAIPLARDYAEKNYPKREDGTFEPAWRGANGEKDLRGKSPEEVAAQLEDEGYTPEAALALARSMVVDIANAPYDQFSEYWKGQNRGGAELLISLVDEVGADNIRALDLSDPEVQEKYGTLIHANWLERNQWVLDPQYGNSVLAQSYADLPADEQQKDIDQVRVLQDWLNDQLLEEFGYSEEERKECSHILGLLEQVRAELVVENPEKYDLNHPNNYYDFKGTDMGLSAAAERLVGEQVGHRLDRRRLYGYDDIMSGVRRNFIKYRLRNKS